MSTTKITGISASHIRLAAAAGLMIAKQGKSTLEIAAAPADALTTLDAAKANIVKDRGDANLFGTLRRKIVAAAPTTDKPAEDLPGIGAAVSADQLAARRAAKANAEPVVTDADAEAVMVANADDAAIVVAADEVAKGLAAQVKARKPRKAKAARNTDAAPAEASAVANPGRAGKGLKAQTLAWHVANPTTPAKAEELKAIFGAKWAGPIRIHQRNLVESGHLVRVGDTKPETYRLADNAPADA